MVWTIVAYGTSTPELAASIAAAGDHSAIILGNIIGSNIANVGMVIGVAAILVPLAVQKSVLRKENSNNVRCFCITCFAFY